MKTYEKADLAVIAVLSALLGIFLGVAWGASLADNWSKREAIQAGVAHYNPTNAVFTWGSFTNSAK